MTVGPVSVPMYPQVLTAVTATALPCTPSLAAVKR